MGLEHWLQVTLGILLTLPGLRFTPLRVSPLPSRPAPQAAVEGWGLGVNGVLKPQSALSRHPVREAMCQRLERMCFNWSWMRF